MNNEIYWETPSELAGRSANLPFAREVLKLQGNSFVLYHNDYDLEIETPSYAYQGTSLELVMTLIETGKFPGGLFKGKFYFKKHENYYEESIKSYARMNARCHYVLKHIGFTPKDFHSFQQWAGYTEDHLGEEDDTLYKEKLVAEGKDFGLTQNKLESIISCIRSELHFSRRLGVILRLSESVLDFGKIREDPADGGSHYIELDGNQRIPLDCLESIEPIGDFEWEFFEDLRKKLGRSF